MSPFQICSTTHHFHVYLSILTNDLTFTALSQSPKEQIPGHCWHTMRCKSTSICEAEQAGKVSPRVMWGAMTRNRAVGLPSNLRKGDRKKRLCLWEMQAFWRHTRKSLRHGPEGSWPLLFLPWPFSNYTRYSELTIKQQRLQTHEWHCRVYSLLPTTFPISMSCVHSLMFSVWRHTCCTNTDPQPRCAWPLMPVTHGCWGKACAGPWEQCLLQGPAPLPYQPAYEGTHLLHDPMNVKASI